MPNSIPLLDLDLLVRRPAAFARELRAGFADFGFVGVRHHGTTGGTGTTAKSGISPEVVAAAIAAARTFFALPLATKLRYEVQGGAGQRGYTRFRTERAKDQELPDLKEFWHVGREVPAGDPLAHALQPNLWPAEVAGFRAAQLALFTALEQLGARLLEAVALGLELPRDWFSGRIDRGNSILRSIHYPPLPDPVTGDIAVADTTGVRAAAHEDINLITLLVGSDEPGLEIRTRAGTWLPVATCEGTEGLVICNVGDMLQRLTNHVLVSTTHRVVNPPAAARARSRMSIPFFLHFNPDVVIETLPGCISPERRNRHPEPIVAHAFLEQRLQEIGLKFTRAPRV